MKGPIVLIILWSAFTGGFITWCFLKMTGRILSKSQAEDLMAKGEWLIQHWEAENRRKREQIAEMERELNRNE